MDCKFKGKELEDLTPEETVEAFKELFNQDITLGEAKDFKNSTGIFSKIFDTSYPDVSFFDILKKSIKNGEPLLVNIPKNISNEMLTNIVEMNNNLIVEVLNDEEVDVVSIVYLKNKTPKN